jgi:anti-anti-sigma factor
MTQKPSLRTTVATDPDRGEQLATLRGKLIGSPECYALLDETRDRVQEGLTAIILDMSEVDMINSAGAGILAAMLTSARNREGSLSVVGLNPRNRQVLEFLHLHQFVRFCDTLAQARGLGD